MFIVNMYLHMCKVYLLYIYIIVCIWMYIYIYICICNETYTCLCLLFIQTESIFQIVCVLIYLRTL